MRRGDAEGSCGTVISIPSRMRGHGIQTFGVHGQGSFVRPPGPSHHQLCHGQRLRQHLHMRRGLAGDDRRSRHSGDGRDLVIHRSQHRYPEPEDGGLDGRRGGCRQRQDPHRPGSSGCRGHDLPHRNGPDAHVQASGCDQGQRRGDRSSVRGRRRREGCGLRRFGRSGA